MKSTCPREPTVLCLPRVANTLENIKWKVLIMICNIIFEVLFTYPCTPHCDSMPLKLFETLLSCGQCASVLIRLLGWFFFSSASAMCGIEPGEPFGSRSLQAEPTQRCVPPSCSSPIRHHGSGVVIYPIWARTRRGRSRWHKIAKFAIGNFNRSNSKSIKSHLGSKFPSPS